MRVFPHRPIPMFVLQRFILVSEYKSHFTETFKDKTIGWTWIKFWVGKESQILRCGFCEFEKSLCHVSFWQTPVQTQIPWIHYEIIRQEGRVGCLLIGRSVNCILHVEDPWMSSKFTQVWIEDLSMSRVRVIWFLYAHTTFLCCLSLQIIFHLWPLPKTTELSMLVCCIMQLSDNSSKFSTKIQSNLCNYECLISGRCTKMQLLLSRKWACLAYLILCASVDSLNKNCE